MMGTYQQKFSRSGSLRIPGCLLLFYLSTYAAMAIGTQSPHIEQVTPGAGNEIVITGIHFGSSCADCEVIVQYPDGFRYAFPARAWSDRQIAAAITDINRGLNFQLFVRTSHGDSNSVGYRLSPLAVPAEDVADSRSPRKGSSLLVFESSHSLLQGDQGEELFQVSSKPPGCGRKSLVFDHAKLVFRQKRFGDARITFMPNPGCLDCAPVKVHWYHEPTGKLTYRLNVYRREVVGICRERIR